MMHSRTMKTEATTLSRILVVVVVFLLLVLYSAGVLVAVVADLETDDGGGGGGGVMTNDIDDNEDRSRISLLHGRSGLETEEAGAAVGVDVDRLRCRRCLCSLSAIMFLSLFSFIITRSDAVAVIFFWFSTLCVVLCCVVLCALVTECL